MAFREPASPWLGPCPQAATRVSERVTTGHLTAQAVILALILLDLSVVPDWSAWQAIMFTLKLDLCGSQITQPKRRFHHQLSPPTWPLHAVPPRLAPRPPRFGVRLLRDRDAS